MNKAGCFVLLFCIGVVFCDDSVHTTILDPDGKYHVSWELFREEQEIIFHVEVQTHGYVGLGLSPNGGMNGSDIVTGWIKDGKIYFQDRHGTGNRLPPVDRTQDWHVLSGNENDTHTSLVFRRKLITCDQEDMEIDDSTMRLIYAYSDKDPTSENDLEYHFQKRGSKSVLLLQQNKRHLVDKSSLLYWDVLSPNFQVPSEYSTMYWCKIYKSPHLTEKHHIILVEPLIQKGHENIVHHLLMYECVGAAPNEYDPHVDAYGHQCHRPNMPDAMKKCEGVFLAWAVGGEGLHSLFQIGNFGMRVSRAFDKYIWHAEDEKYFFRDLVLPEHVGLPLDPSPSKYYMLEIHYDNPFHKEGIVDQSGFRIYYTPELREYDAGSLMIGSTISARMLIPPGRPQFVVAGHGNPSCLEPAMPEEGVKVFGVFLHAHLLGRRIKARHFRNSTELPPLAVDSNYDFNYQEYRYYQEEVPLLPGDQVTVECTYDSSGRDETTFGGESTRQEMCLVFLLYYPRIERFASLSVPILPLINTLFNTSLKMKDVRDGSFYKYFRHYNWEKTNLNIVENSLRYAMHDTHCYLGNGEKNSVQSLISYPIDLIEYKISTPCGKGTEKSRRHGNKDVSSGIPSLRVNGALLSYLFLYSTLAILWQRIQFPVRVQ